MYTETKNLAIRTQLKEEVNSGSPLSLAVSASMSGTKRVYAKLYEPNLIWKSCWTAVCVNKYKWPCF